jgi:hypothetical protein
LAYLLAKLKETKEGSGNLLDNSMIVYGSGNSDGNAHNHDDLPHPTRGWRVRHAENGSSPQDAKETPLNNLWSSLLDRIQIKVDRLGDSTGNPERIRRLIGADHRLIVSRCGSVMKATTTACTSCPRLDFWAGGSNATPHSPADQSLNRIFDPPAMPIVFAKRSILIIMDDFQAIHQAVGLLVFGL